MEICAQRVKKRRTVDPISGVHRLDTPIYHLRGEEDARGEGKEKKGTAKEEKRSCAKNAISDEKNRSSQLYPRQRAEIGEGAEDDEGVGEEEEG